MSTFASSNVPLRADAISSNKGVSDLHGPHHLYKIHKCRRARIIACTVPVRMRAFTFARLRAV